MPRTTKLPPPLDVYEYLFWRLLYVLLWIFAVTGIGGTIVGIALAFIRFGGQGPGVTGEEILSSAVIGVIGFLGLRVWPEHLGHRIIDRRPSMDTETMGRVLTEAQIENMEDLWAYKRGLISEDQVRRLDVLDALVDTGATLLSLPTRLIEQLGLEKTASKRVSSSLGLGEAAVYSAVRLTVQGRSCTMDVMEIPDDVPVLIGQIPLEHLDLVVDQRNRRLIGNPAHGGEHVYELY